jgi:Cu+-exporting ATPase
MNPPPTRQVIELPISGMTCAACSTRLEKNLNRLEGVSANVNLATEKARVEFDPALADPAAIAEQVRKTGFSVPAQTLDLAISGMTCAACSTRLERVLNQVPGVEARVNLATEKARLRYTPGLARRPTTLVAAVARAGFAASPITEASRAEEKARKAAEYRNELRVFLIAALFTLPLLAQMVPMLGGAHHVEWMPPWLQWLLATPVQFWAGRRFYTGAWNSLRGGGANMDVLVALGTSAAYFFSVAVILLGLDSHVYFEASAAVVTLVRLGKLLEARAKSRTSAAIEQLLGLQPRTAWVEREMRAAKPWRWKPHCSRSATWSWCAPANASPVDGRVMDGASSLDESLLTGESLPVPRRRATRVHAGTQNLDGTLRVRAEGVGAHTQLMEIVRLTEAAQGSKAPIQKLADRISGVFVPAVIAIATAHLRRLVAGQRRFHPKPDSRRGGAGHRLPLRPGPGHAHGGDGGPGSGRATGHPGALGGSPGAGGETGRPGPGQDRHPDRGKDGPGGPGLRPGPLGGSAAASGCRPGTGQQPPHRPGGSGGGRGTGPEPAQGGGVREPAG